MLPIHKIFTRILRYTLVKSFVKQKTRLLDNKDMVLPKLKTSSKFHSLISKSNSFRLAKFLGENSSSPVEIFKKLQEIAAFNSKFLS